MLFDDETNQDDDNKKRIVRYVEQRQTQLGVERVRLQMQANVFFSDWFNSARKKKFIGGEEGPKFGWRVSHLGFLTRSLAELSHISKL